MLQGTVAPTGPGALASALHLQIVVFPGLWQTVIPLQDLYNECLKVQQTREAAIEIKRQALEKKTEMMDGVNVRRQKAIVGAFGQKNVGKLSSMMGKARADAMARRHQDKEDEETQKHEELAAVNREHLDLKNELRNHEKAVASTQRKQAKVGMIVTNK